MPEFLHLLPPGEALERLLMGLPEPAPLTEEIDTLKALGRVTAQAVISPEALPAFSRSTVDGYGLHAADTYGARDSLPVYLELAGEAPMGAEPGFGLGRRQAALVYTGGMLPEGADAVVMVEQTQASRPGELEVLRAAAPAENILLAGEDAPAGAVVIAGGIRLRPAEIGGLMALGLTRVLVARLPRVGILSSGDEVISPQETPRAGQVRDVNSYTLAALVQQAGGAPVRYGILPDRAEEVQLGLTRALEECDMVVLTAGSSASARDLTAEAIQNAGRPGVLVHGVAVRPGKPTILAVCDGKPVIGLPGNPVSALVIAGLFVKPVIERLGGESAARPRGAVAARLTLNLASQAGREDWAPVRLISTPAVTLAEPIFYKSNLIFGLARADGLICIPADSTGLAAGEDVSVVILA
jgi:molybdopterin molybdotransferase